LGSEFIGAYAFLQAMKNSMPSAGDDDLQDSDDLDEELSDEDDSDAMEVDGKDEDNEADSPAEDDGKQSSAIQYCPLTMVDFSDDDGSALSFGEDEDDLLSESEMPNIPLGSAFPPSEDEEEAEEDSATVGKRKRDDKKAQRKKRKAMPMFASADDYAALIDAEGDGDE
jgi:ribosome biogenesis protein MAK21